MLKKILQFYATIGIPFLYLFILLVINSTSHTLSSNMILTLVGLVFSLTGLVLWILSYKHLGTSFGVLPKHQKKVTRGVYKYLSHPMYIGIGLTFIGLSLSLRSYPGLVITVFILVPLLVIRAFFENRKLISKKGH